MLSYHLILCDSPNGHIAIEKGNIIFANNLINAGAKVDSYHPITKQPFLHIATKEGNLELIELLLKAGADVFYHKLSY